MEHCGVRIADPPPCDAAQPDGRRVLDANIAVHSRLAAEYDATEPHFRPENVAKVDAELRRLVERTNALSLLDLGCGTGFMINIAAKHVQRVVGVDATQAMLDRVSVRGPARIELHCADTGAFNFDAGSFEIVTAYSFLHHLYDIAPTLRTAYRALRPGGVFYADLDPNFYFWQAVGRLDPDGAYHAVLAREVAAVLHKDEEIQQRFDIARDLFNDAEYGKNRLGGFREEELRAALQAVGFSEIEVLYHWFPGQAQVIHDPLYSRHDGIRHAEICEAALRRLLPLTRHLFKYLRILAVKPR